MTTGTNGSRRVLRRTVLGALATGILAAGVAAWRQQAVPAGARSAARPAGHVLELVEVRPFELERPYRHLWSADRPLVDRGWIVVLAVERAAVEPRQMAMPVLYAGDRTVERLNHGHRSGHAVGLVPHSDAIPEDFAGVRVWFGAPDLPERVDPPRIRAELARAEADGVAPFAAEVAAAARERGGETLRLAHRGALLRRAADLVARYSPDEEALAKTLREEL